MRSKFERKKIKIIRSEDGFSLVMVMSIGLIGLMGSMAVTSMLFSGKRFSDQTQTRERVVHDAEVAINYAIRILCKAKAEQKLALVPTVIGLPQEIKGLAENPTQIPINTYSAGLSIILCH